MKGLFFHKKAFLNPIRAVGSLLARENERWALWSPVFLGGGIGLYFALPFEPPLWLGLCAAALSGLGVVLIRSGWRLAVLALMVVWAGFAVGQWRTALVAAPVVKERLGPATILGRAVMVEAFPKSLRLTLEMPRVTGLGPENTPAKVRLRLRGRQPRINPG
ncbi:MAG: ComEC family competence protein, partial [Rhodospirillales bacterium]